MFSRYLALLALMPTAVAAQEVPDPENPYPTTHFALTLGKVNLSIDEATVVFSLDPEQAVVLQQLLAAAISNGTVTQASED